MGGGYFKGGPRLTANGQFIFPKQSPVIHAAPRPSTPSSTLGPLPSPLNEQLVRPQIRPAQSALTNIVWVAPGASSKPPDAGAMPDCVTTPGQIVSSQLLATISWIGVLLSGDVAGTVAVALAVVLVVVVVETRVVELVVVDESVTVELVVADWSVVVESKDVAVALLVVVFHRLVVAPPVVRLNDGLVEFEAVMLHGVRLLMTNCWA